MHYLIVVVDCVSNLFARSFIWTNICQTVWKFRFSAFLAKSLQRVSVCLPSPELTLSHVRWRASSEVIQVPGATDWRLIFIFTKKQLISFWRSILDKVRTVVEKTQILIPKSLQVQSKYYLIVWIYNNDSKMSFFNHIRGMDHWYRGWTLTSQFSFPK